MSQPPDLRASDADREAVVTRLQHAGAEGRLDVDELAERIGLADAARTMGDLVPLTADLPEVGPNGAVVAPRPFDAPDDRSRWVVAVMSGADRMGRWRPSRRTNAVAVMGGVDLDLRDAEITGDLEINAVAVMGGIEVHVPPGVEVEVTGFSFMGAHGGPKPEPVPAGAPTVRVRAYALMGGVDVSRKRRKPIKA